MRHNVRQLTEDEWMDGGLTRFSVSNTSRTHIEQCVRRAHPPVSGLDLLARGDAPPADAHMTVIVARSIASVEVIGLPPVQLAIAEACAFDAALIVRLRGDSIVLHFGLRDVEKATKASGKARRCRMGCAEIPPLLLDDRHDALDSTAAQHHAVVEERAKAAEQRAIIAEQRAADAEERAKAVEGCAKAAEQRETAANERAKAATDAFTRLRGQAQSAAPLRREVTRGLLLRLHPDKATGPIQRIELRAMIEAALAAYPENQLAHRLMLMCSQLGESGYVERVVAYQEILGYTRE